MKSTIRHAHAIRITALVLCAMLARILGQHNIWVMPFGLAHTVICIFLCIGFGVSAHQRIVHTTVRGYMLAISAMTVFWFAARTVKYYFTLSETLSRYLWYSYYVPLLFIPCFVMLIAKSIGKAEKAASKQSLLLMLPPLLLSALVLTNDCHQAVFSFPDALSMSDEHYRYAPLCTLIWLYTALCSAIALALLFARCRRTKKRKMLPALLLLLCCIYCIIYITGGCRGAFKVLAGDMVMVMSLLIIGTLESAIACGLIPTNTGYAELFEAGTAGAQITDLSFTVHYAASNAPSLPAETLQSALPAPAALDKHTLLKGHPIPGGAVFWQEDITALTQLLEQLEKNRKALAKSNHIAEESLRIKREIHARREKNRLYDLLHAKVMPQIHLLNRLFSQYEEEQSPSMRRALLGTIAVVGTYIKRCGNLLFIGEKADTVDTAELSLCMEESFAALSLMDIECATDIPAGHRIATQDALGLYDLFEQLTEAALGSLCSVWLKARSEENALIFRLEMECDADLAALLRQIDSHRDEDGVWSIALRIQKAGDAA